MSKAIDTLSKLDERGKLGYAIARNRRLLTEAATEFLQMKDKLIAQYGEPQGSGSYRLTKEAQDKINSELAEFAGIEHEVNVMTVDEETFYSGGLSSQQMYDIWWMAE